MSMDIIVVMMQEGPMFKKEFAVCIPKFMMSNELFLCEILLLDRLVD